MTDIAYDHIVGRAVLNPETACWLWPGAISGAGYGVIGNRLGHRTHNCYVHRLMAWLHLGYDGAPEIEVCHRCNEKLCFNPDHLYLAGHAQNMMDAGRDSLMRFGENHHAAKLTAVTAAEVKALLAAGVSRAVVARQYGVSKGTIQDLAEGRTWKRVSDG